MSGFETVLNVKRSLNVLVDKYYSICKDSSKKTVTEAITNKRKKFMSDFSSLFDIGNADLEKSLKEDKIRNHLNATKGDLDFLIDQRTTRIGSIGQRDLEYEVRRATAQNRREMQFENDCSQNTAPFSQTDDATSDKVNAVSEPLCGSFSDPDFNSNLPAKRQKIINIQIPYNFISSPAITAALDRDKVSSPAAMRLFSAMLKDQQTVDGQVVDLNKFDISTATIRRNRIKSRDLLCDEAIEKFHEDRPERLVLHWDEKMMTDLLGDTNEMEAIVISGAPT